MAVTWDVVALDATKTVGSLSDVVTVIHWTATDSETVGSGDSAVTYTGSNYGVASLAAPSSKSFTAYKDITKENAIKWTKDVLGSDRVTSIETGIAQQIEKSKTPTTSTGVPWS